MIGDTIDELIKSNGESIWSLSASIGVSRAAIAKWIKNETRPSIQNAQALANHFSQPIDLFLSDDRKTEYEIMQKTDAMIAQADSDMRPRMKLEQEIEKTTQTSPDTHILVGILPETESGCGNGVINADWDTPAEFMWVSREWLRQSVRSISDSIVIIRARGDSMEPTISNGDLILVDTKQQGNRTDGIYVIQRGDFTYTKRLQFLDRKIIVISDNPFYEKEVVTNDIKICGKVVWIWNGQSV